MSQQLDPSDKTGSSSEPQPGQVSNERAAQTDLSKEQIDPEAAPQESSSATDPSGKMQSTSGSQPDQVSSEKVAEIEPSKEQNVLKAAPQEPSSPANDGNGGAGDTGSNQTGGSSASPASTEDTVAEQRALLMDALNIIYDARDTGYAQLVTWHNKSMWFVMLALLLIVGLGLYRNPIFLLLGALGGLLSRLSRVMRAANLPTDYGAFWTNLFLSPLYGALAAWSGILLVSMLVSVNVLGDTFGEIQWYPPITTTPAGTPATTLTTTASAASTSTALTSTSVAALPPGDSPAITQTVPPETGTVNSPPPQLSPTVAAGSTTTTGAAVTSSTATTTGTDNESEQDQGPASDQQFPNVFTLGLALLLGFAERLLPDVVDRLQSTVVTPSPSGSNGTKKS